MITCRQFESFIMAYLEGELPSRQRYVFELHLKLCRECREYLIAYKATMALAKGAVANAAKKIDQPPEDLVKAVVAARKA